MKFHDPRETIFLSRGVGVGTGDGLGGLSQFYCRRLMMTINVASRVLTRDKRREKCPPPSGHIFQPTRTSKLDQDSIGTLLTKFHNIRKYMWSLESSPPGGHVFQLTGTIFELIQDIIGKNLLAQFHDDQTINVASRVKNALPPGSHFHEDVASRVLTRQMINIVTKFHKDWMKTVTSIVNTSNLINILIKFYKDWMKTVTSIVYKSRPKYNPNPDFIKINTLTEFHKDWMKTVTSTVYTNKLFTDTRTHIRTPDITWSHKLTMSLRDR
ncbi:hypothetical protein DPMN_077518 [Dreissena polymorpha]|uniref:Uncharacterized protein n=1 Tax=Dreissena polymorpha TaxID=45954 RepID=A0A9D4BGP9_DREPO|nr:hypothetical protein DPMN_077518 [Dreissena polymorpha]